MNYVTSTRITRKTWGTYLAASLLGLVVVIVYESLFDGVRYPYSSDSAAYIEQAQNLNSGTGLYSTPYEPYPVNTDLERLHLFPPGYSLAIALVSRLGFAEDTIAPWLNRLAAAMLPAALLFGFAARFGTTQILTVGVLVILSPGVLTFQYPALADTIFLLLATLSIGQLVRGPQDVRALLLSGALAGLAYCFRNAGAALLVAVPTALLASSLLRLGPWKAYLSSGLIWTGGAAIFVVPLVGYNILIFGALQPYYMAPSTIGLNTNAAMFMTAQVADVLGFRLLAHGSVPLVLPFVGVIGFVLVTTYAWRRLVQEDKEVVVVLACYILVGAGVVVLARTLYQWGETISIRHTMQYSWAIVVLLVVVVNALMRGVSAKRRTLLTAAVTSALLVLRIADVYGASIRPSDSTKLVKAASENQMLMSKVAAIPPEALICSNVAYLFRITLARPVRQVRIDSLDSASHQTLERLVRDITPHRAAYFVLVPRAVALTQQTIPEYAVQWLRSIGAENIVNRLLPPAVALTQQTIPDHAVDWLRSIGVENIVNRPDFAVFGFSKRHVIGDVSQ